MGFLRLRIQDEPITGNIQDALMEELQKSTTFLVIDNFESVWQHDPDAEEFIEELAFIPAVSLLITTGPRSFCAIDIYRGIELVQLPLISLDA